MYVASVTVAEAPRGMAVWMSSVGQNAVVFAPPNVAGESVPSWLRYRIVNVNVLRTSAKDAPLDRSFTSIVLVTLPGTRSMSTEVGNWALSAETLRMVPTRKAHVRAQDEGKKFFMRLWLGSIR